MVWYFADSLITFSVTGQIASTLTMHHLQSTLSRPEDLVHHRVAIVSGSPAGAGVQDRGIKCRRYPTQAAALEAVAQGRIIALVAPAPLLKHTLTQQVREDLRVLPFTVDPMDYPFALPDGSLLREAVNQGSRRTISEPAWRELLYRCLWGMNVRRHHL